MRYVRGYWWMTDEKIEMFSISFVFVIKWPCKRQFQKQRFQDTEVVAQEDASIFFIGVYLGTLPWSPLEWS